MQKLEEHHIEALAWFPEHLSELDPDMVEVLEELLEMGLAKITDVVLWRTTSKGDLVADYTYNEVLGMVRSEEPLDESELTVLNMEHMYQLEKEGLVVSEEFDCYELTDECKRLIAMSKPTN